MNRSSIGSVPPPILVVQDVSKVYRSVAGEHVHALKNVSMVLRQNEFLSIVGPSGSGKSTLLRLIAGLEESSSGEISFNQGRSQQRIGLVFQEISLLPWRTVERNLTYALELRGISKRSRKQSAVELCGLIDLDSKVFLHRYPKELSGGERKRVSIGMAIAQEADLLLLDEPTAHLDYLSKAAIQRMLEKLWCQKGFSAIVVTHDLDEAIQLGDRLYVLDKGRTALEIEISLQRPRFGLAGSDPAVIEYRERVMKYHTSGTMYR